MKAKQRSISHCTLRCKLLALIKEHGELSDKQVEKIHAETGIDVGIFCWSQFKWYLMKDGNLDQASYATTPLPIRQKT